MSSLHYLHGIIADVKCENVTAEPVLGRYRLLFHLSFDLKNWQGSGQLRGYVPSLTSLLVVVKLNGTVIGTAFPEGEDFLPSVHPGTLNTVAVQRSFSLDIDSRTLDKIEQERKVQDVSFELEVLGTGTVFALRDANSQHASTLPEPLGIEPLLFEPRLAKTEIHHQLPQSKWIELLGRMGYTRILLYEIPWPKSNDEKLNEAMSYFESARESFLSNSYTNAVVELRKSLESAWTTISCEKLVWSNKVKNSGLREKMTLPERFLLTWNSIHHLTHPAAHRSSKYSRDEAHYILGMGALALSLAANAAGMLEEARKEAGQQQ